MYTKLFKPQRAISITDDTKFPCPSLPVPFPPVVQPYEAEVMFNNREYFTQTLDQSRPAHPPTTAPRQTLISSLVDRATPSTSTSTRVSTPSVSIDLAESDRLLPVLDCRFNLREICKQCILLEDHLTHEKKRCTDCCVKHFLFLEGLLEEAVALDSEGIMINDIKDLPDKIREIQKMWYKDPVKNSHHCSQELRKLRKKFQIDTFPIVFDDSDNKQAPVMRCGDGACRIKK